MAKTVLNSQAEFELKKLGFHKKPFKCSMSESDRIQGSMLKTGRLKTTPFSGLF